MSKRELGGTSCMAAHGKTSDKSQWAQYATLLSVLYDPHACASNTASSVARVSISASVSASASVDSAAAAAKPRDCNHAA